MTNENLGELKVLLDRASHEDLANLGTIINATLGNSSDKLCDHMQYLRSGFMGQFIDGRNYKQLVTDAADHVQIDWLGLLKGRQWNEVTVAEIEDAIVVRVLQRVIGQMSDEDRRLLAESLGKASDYPNLLGELLAGGAMILARLSGIQIYLLATTAVGALTAGLGITLPFVIYTTISRGLGVVLGPIGWILLGISTLLSLNKTNWSRLIPGIIYVSYIRHKLESEN